MNYENFKQHCLNSSLLCYCCCISYFTYTINTGKPCSQVKKGGKKAKPKDSSETQGTFLSIYCSEISCLFIHQQYIVLHILKHCYFNILKYFKFFYLVISTPRSFHDLVFADFLLKSVDHSVQLFLFVFCLCLVILEIILDIVNFALQRLMNSIMFL